MSYSRRRRDLARGLRFAPWLVIGGLVVSACTTTTEAASSGDESFVLETSESDRKFQAESGEPVPSAEFPGAVQSTPTTRSSEADVDSSGAPPADDEPQTTTDSTSTSTTPTTVPDPDVHDPVCVAEVTEFGALDAVLAEDEGSTVRPVDLWVENDFRDGGVAVGDLIDICVGNEIDDVTGETRIAPVEQVVADARAEDVKRQQERLNELFAGSAIAPLDVDGVSGPRTRQRLCAARLAIGLPTSTSDMQPGSMEHLILFTISELPTPRTTAVESERWILIDRTCQIMFTGEGRDTLFVFPTSTGTEGFETRDQDRTEAFRFNPAADNGGWHDSTDYPVGVDNPLNGNMYKPLYFDLGQAIHGANSVPASPASKGCARLQVAHQDLLLGWLGLGATTAGIWRADEIRVTVNVQGDFVAR